ncbi:MAG TPA: M20/M25/M40 family metallo-hydrolase [Steroidobacteraceae bacterium]|nr:M20/M25/M40 family metallo-hydrolase [Steroidobacteraceae bacterium]
MSVSVTVLALLLNTTTANTQNADVGRAAFREIYQEMVEIDSSPSTGSCTKVVRAAESRLLAAGFAADDVQVVIPEGKPDDGNIVARLRAPGAKKKGVLLLAHIDVVDARRADWERDPFKLVEEGGYFYGRGAVDDKAMAAVFLDLMLRLKQERGFKPKRDLIMALTCGEETSNRVNGVDYLLTNKRELIDAAFAINEGAGGLLSSDGQKRLVLQVQAGEKIHQVFTLEVSNKGGHSSRPERDNAIYRLARATLKVEELAFPLELTPVVREYFRVTGPTLGGELGAAMTAVATNPHDQAALATLMNDPSYNAVLHTTCVATQLDAGHAPNALPQRATATLSCRVMQGTTPEQVKETLEKAVADNQVKVQIVRRRTGSQAPELTDEVMKPVRAAAAKLWPGVPVAPSMTPGATDGRYLMSAGIPTYGMSGMFAVPGEGNAHGLNEKIRVTSLYEGREFLETIVRAYVK